MPDTTKMIDGNFSLDELRQTLITQEQLGFTRLAGLSVARGDTPLNTATFKDDADPNPPAELMIVPIGTGEDVNAVATAQKKLGHDLLFTSTVFVSGKRTQISVFR